MDIDQLLFKDHRNAAHGSNGFVDIKKIFFHQLGSTANRQNQICQLIGVDRAIGIEHLAHRICANKVSKAIHINRFVFNQLIQDLVRNDLAKTFRVNRTVGDQRTQHLIRNKLAKTVRVNRAVIDQRIQDLIRNKLTKAVRVNRAVIDQRIQDLVRNKLAKTLGIDRAVIDQRLQHLIRNKLAKTFRIDRSVRDQRIQNLIRNKLAKTFGIDRAVIDQRIQNLIRHQLAKALGIDRAIGDQRIQDRGRNQIAKTLGINRAVVDQYIQYVLLLNQCRKLCGGTRIIRNHVSKHVFGHDEIDNLILGFLIGEHLVDDRIANIRKFLIVQNDRYDLVHELIICHGIILLQVIENGCHRGIIQHTALQYDACGAVDVNHLGQLTRAIQVAKNGNKIKRSEQRFLRDELPDQRIWLLREILDRHIHGHHLIQLVGIVAHHHIQISL